MPNYRGLNVLKYECDLIEAFNKQDEAEILLLNETQDLYKDKDIRANLIKTYQSCIYGRSDKLSLYRSKYEEYSQLHDYKDPDISHAPLEFLYQQFLHDNLLILLRCIENSYRNYYNALLSNGITHLSLTTRKVATHHMYYSSIGHIVTEHLLEKEIQELRKLPKHLKEYASEIQDKYEYFKDRIVCCPEIGALLRELSK